MAMPRATPIPFSSNVGESLSPSLIEPVLHKHAKCIQRLNGIGTFCLDSMVVPGAAASIMSPMIERPETRTSSFSTDHLCLESRQDRNELGGRTRMQSALVDDYEPAAVLLSRFAGG